MGLLEKAAINLLNNINNKIKTDFLGFIGSLNGAWIGTATQSGSAGASFGTAKHPGLVGYLCHASNANSGYKMVTDATCILLAGGEKTTIIFKTPSAITGVTRRIGFHDTLDVNAPTDGVYVLISETTLTGQTMSNGTGSTTGTSYTVSTATFYRLVIELNADATLATFTLYADDSDTVLWTDTLATNIPTGAGRTVGHGDVCTLASPSGAINIGYLDYIDIVLPNARKVS